MKKLVVIILMLSLVIVIACNEDSKEIDAEKVMAVEKVSKQYTEAIHTENVDGIMALMTDDHVYMMPNLPAIETLEGLRAWHQARVDIYTMDFSIKINKISIEGNCALEQWMGYYTKTPRDGGAQIHEKFKGLWVWRLEADGTWKLARSIWNSELPAPGSN